MRNISSIMTVLLLFPLTAAAEGQETLTLPRQRIGAGSIEDAHCLDSGRLVAMGGGNGAFLVSGDTGQVIRRYLGHTQTVYCVALSPDGSRLATGSADHTIRLWDVQTGRTEAVLSGHTAIVGSIKYSGDGGVLLSATSNSIYAGIDLNLRLWSSSGEPLAVFDSGDYYLNNMPRHDLSSDGRFVAYAYKETQTEGIQAIKIWDRVSETEKSIPLGLWDQVNDLAFSPDATEMIVSVYHDGAPSPNAVEVWDLTGAPVLSRPLANVSGTVWPVAVTADGSRVLGYCGGFSVWDITTGDRLTTFPFTGSMWPKRIWFSADGSRLYAVSAAYSGRNFYSWDAGSWQSLDDPATPPEQLLMYPLAIVNPADPMIAAAGTDGIILGDMITGEIIRGFIGGVHTITTLAASPTENLIAVGGQGVNYVGEISLRNPQTGQETGFLTGQHGSVNTLAFSPDGTMLAAGSNDASSGSNEPVVVWDVETRTRRSTVTGAAAIKAVAFTPDSSQLLAVGRVDDNATTNSVFFYNPNTGALIRSVDTGTASLEDVAVSPDGSRYALACFYDYGAGQGRAEIRSMANSALLTGIVGHSAPIVAVDFSGDGSLLATGTMNYYNLTDNTAKVWDVQTGELRFNVTGHGSTVRDMKFLPGGNLLATGSADGSTGVWELKPPRAIIVAGGGNFSGNAIGQQTQDVAAYAYKALIRRGYAAAGIRYLSAFGPTDPEDPSIPFRDADGDGLNDVDGWSTLDNLHEAITGEFAQGAGRLMIFLIDHGNRTGEFMAFRMIATQSLLSTTLDGWLDDLQTPVGGGAAPEVTLVVDSCYSGQMVKDCRLIEPGGGS